MRAGTDTINHASTQSTTNMNNTTQRNKTQRNATNHQKAKKEVRLEPDCAPPGPRVNASLVPLVTPRASELILFGGEVVDLSTGKVMVNADLYRYDVDKAKWTRVHAPSRCAHVVVCKGRGGVWLGGGAGGVHLLGGGARGAAAGGQQGRRLLRGIRQRHAKRKRNQKTQNTKHDDDRVIKPRTQPVAALRAPGGRAQGLHVCLWRRVLVAQPGALHALPVRDWMILGGGVII